jgi:wyosine [tRNA(Phe)-imidazoG37] synthetase (radical SAM superfamily)
MATFLFDKTIFGPVKSRRLGVSLGINLLPNDCKLCSFNCIYCECGWNPDPRTVKVKLPAREDVKLALEIKLKEMASQNELPDVITFAGNGEPTLHPKFSEVITDTLMLRDLYAPSARVAVLSNSTMLFKPEVVEALKKVEDNILKLDSAVAETIQLMDAPVGHFDLNKVVKQLASFNGKLIIQTMFLRGTVDGKSFDNTTVSEVAAWIDLLRQINPERVMIYTIARDTPSNSLEKISIDDLNKIATQVKEQLNIDVEVSA